MFKNKTKKIAASMLAVVMVLGLGASPAVVMADTLQGTTVHVVGAGAISVAPDIATITLGANTSEPTPQAAITRNNVIINDILAALEALNIDEDDIRTQHFSLHQEWNFDHMTGRSFVDGYMVHNSVHVTVRDLDRIGEIIGAGVDAGANISTGVSFGVEDTSAIYYDALALAIQDARNKGNHIARALGTTVAGIASVTEVQTWNMPFARAAGMPQAEMMMMVDTVVSHDVPLVPGNLEITARVEVAFVLAR